MEIELKEEELEGCITKDEYANLWQYARIRTAEDMLGLLSFGEMMDESRDPVGSFATAMLMWLDSARREIRRREEAETSEDTVTPRRIH